MIDGLYDEGVHIGPVMEVTRTNIKFDNGILRLYQSLDELNCLL